MATLICIDASEHVLKGYCTVFKHTLKSLEITGIVLS